MRVAFLVAPEGVEESELTGAWKAVTEAGGEAVLVSTWPGEVLSFRHLDKGERFVVDQVVGEVSAGMFDALVLPGGVANPDHLRTDEEAVDLVKDFVDQGRPVAAICHAPWLLIEAGAVRGRTLTSYPSLATDIRNAGGTWVDEPVRVDSSGPTTLITSRTPHDLPAFTEALVGVFTTAAAAGR
ncbi:MULTISPECIES: type 1 glutamine amidotransferase domain-containing protein [Streptomyces]|nr:MULTISPECIES: type 1 glutamine amidotransferase domain-containing protein [Streptomyces]NEE27492.1 type 1 glutamine amidotransferase [Streptomyces sp. SID7982]NEE59739.1 type 1 glutamine amidotransferase [Streptomyces sp. SID8455]MBL3803515.1 type 1 glutamine amidotransferase [Streptomyces sp. BRB081]MDQ0292568.1 protease I [Streptomyces sp. DSM 41037]NEC14702.1 type 1 glutamine amidotransferase [Streptomyces sp. SID8014]